MVPIILSLLLVSSADGLSRCKEVGRFPLEDPQAYMECSLTHTNEFVSRVESCGNFYYSPSKKTCVPGKNEVLNGPTLKKGRIRRNSDVSFPSPVDFEIASQTECGKSNITGIFCFNRTHVALCIATYSDVGAYTSKTLAFPCLGDTVCLAGEGCKNNDTLLSRAHPFVCSDVGRFPDQYNCTIYHDCAASTTGLHGFSKNTTECLSGQVYSIKLRACTNVTEIDSCFPGIYCYSDLEVGTLIDDNSIYYVCHTDANYPGDLSPSLYNCPSQQVFNPAVLACVSTVSNLPWSELPSPAVFK